jgi:hypothetical protein
MIRFTVGVGVLCSLAGLGGEIARAETAAAASASVAGDIAAREELPLFMSPISAWRRFRFDSAFSTTSLRAQEGIARETMALGGAGEPVELSVVRYAQEMEYTRRLPGPGATKTGLQVSVIALGGAPSSGQSFFVLPAGFRLGARLGGIWAGRLRSWLHWGLRGDGSALWGDDFSLTSAVAAFEPMSQPTDVDRLYLSLLRPEYQYQFGIAGAAAARLPAYPKLELQGAVRFDVVMTENQYFSNDRWQSTRFNAYDLSQAAAVGWRMTHWIGFQAGLIGRRLFQAGSAGMMNLAVILMGDNGRVQFSAVYARSLGQQSVTNEVILRLLATTLP